MGLFSNQKVYCNVCGKQFETNFSKHRGRVCSAECAHELQWLEALAIMGKEYYPRPKSDPDLVSV